MQKRLLAFAVATSLLALAGCSTTGGTIGGLLPAPKFLKGTIEHNIYTAKDGSFRVASPHDKGSYEFTYMAVKEQYGPMGAYVSFGPAAFDQSIYRVNVSGRKDPAGIELSFEALAPQAVASFRAQLEKGYGTELVEQSSEPTMLGELRALTWTFTQYMPSRTTLQGTSSADSLTHRAIAIDGGEVMALLWVQTPGSCSNCSGTGEKFVSSFAFTR